MLLRLPFLGAPLTADEGGYAETARLWQGGRSLYSDLWVDRPQGLELVYRLALDVHLGSVAGLRLLAALLSAATVVLVAAVGRRLGGSLTACLAGALLALAGSSPWIEAFTLSGELAAALLAVGSMLLFLLSDEGRRLPVLAAAGLMGGCAIMVKQPAFDAVLAIAAWLLLANGRRAMGRVAALSVSALVPVALGPLSAKSPEAWWSEVIAYRGAGNSILTAPPLASLGGLLHAAPAAVLALGPLVLVALLGRQRIPLLVRLWVGAATLGVLGGGAFHPHYFIQLAPPLAVAAALAAPTLPESRRRIAVAALVVCAATALPLWLVSSATQASWIWPRDPHLRSDGALAAYIRSHTVPGTPVAVVWAAADVYYLADRPPALRYLWFRNLQSVPDALATELRTLRCDHPALVALVQAPGRAAALLSRDYRRAAVVNGVAVLAPRAGSRAGCPTA